MSEHPPRAEPANGTGAFAKSDDDVGCQRAMREQLTMKEGAAA
jgi:hypothetical protein